MGMPISIDIPGATNSDVFQAVFDFFRQVDANYSPYIDTSKVSLFAAGKIEVSQLSAELALIAEQCKYYEELTNGYFSAYYAGTFDPSGYVKAWAIDKAASIITAIGYDTFLINIAGDMSARGSAKIWNLAIQDPFNKQEILGTVRLANQAIATSGTYARGNHIFDPHTQKNTTDLLSVTVYGPDVIKSDVLATALVAMGYDNACAFMKTQPAYAALLIKLDGQLTSLNDFKLIA